MKRKILIVIVYIISANIFSQTYKLETVLKDKFSETFLTHWKVLESIDVHQTDTFSLWGYQQYSDDWISGAYEIEYFKGNAKETYLFLHQIFKFTEKYQEDDKIVSNILGVRVMTFKQGKIKYTFVYDKEKKVVCKFNLKQCSELLASFISFCDKQKINFN